MNGEVESHQLSELGVTVAQHVSEVVGPVQVGVNGTDAAALTVQVAIDFGGNARQLSNQVHGVFVDELMTRACERIGSQTLPHQQFSYNNYNP